MGIKDKLREKLGREPTATEIEDARKKRDERRASEGGKSPALPPSAARGGVPEAALAAAPAPTAEAVSHKRPRGGAPKGKTWDAATGEWVDKPEGSTSTTTPKPAAKRSKKAAAAPLQATASGSPEDSLRL